MISYANENIEFEGCPACAYAKHEFSLPCGMAYENERFTLSQDWELPIQGFFVVAPKHCVENLSELTDEERIRAFDLVNETIKILKASNVCDRFNVIFEEKQGSHFHIWIMPRHKWMEDVAGKITKNIGMIFNHAKQNLRTEENLKEISKISQVVKEGLKNFKR